MNRSCGQCALRQPETGMCPIFNATVNDEYGCPYFTTEIRTCSICGSIIPKGGFIENGKLLCGDCATGVACKRCKHKHSCALEQDQTCPEPLYTMVRQQRGNTIIQTQQINPKRIDLTCKKGCPCYINDICMKRANCGCQLGDLKNET